MTINCFVWNVLSFKNAKVKMKVVVDVLVCSRATRTAGATLDVWGGGGFALLNDRRAGFNVSS